MYNDGIPVAVAMMEGFTRCWAVNRSTEPISRAPLQRANVTPSSVPSISFEYSSPSCEVLVGIRGPEHMWWQCCKPSRRFSLVAAGIGLVWTGIG